MDKNTFILLTDRYLDGTATEAEKRLVDAYCDRLEQIPVSALTREEEDALEVLMYARIMGKVQQRPIRRSLYKYAAAAAVVLAAGAAFFLLRPTNKPVEPLAREVRFKNDISPAGNKPTLMLADGSVVALDDSSNNGIAAQGGTRVLQSAEGALEYQPGAAAAAPVFNTLTTPAGCQFRLILADGSKVWLNAASSIRFPTAFRGEDRIVELEGEAYLEVSKDAARPFRVITRGMTVHVLGTHFNINAYKDEPVIRTSLLEGAVRVAGNGQSEVLSPGQQAQVRQNGKMYVADGVDMRAVTAWKEGRFNFSGEPITEVMREIQRWYGAEIIYNGEVKHHFVGSIPRNLPVSRVLEMLEMTGRVRFEIDGKKITVRP
ncbi:FecR family protein [Chitinophaga rhizosphaerae]|uniref:FecR family protein n=1 Tax=Chitinophaga rhizosphaerae TaxID=1864947 RepID=UPI0013DFAAD8|nr:FecR family protein [Chitinophaga rhizosphaerae]